MKTHQAERMPHRAGMIVRWTLALAATLPPQAFAQLAPDTIRAINAIAARALEDKSVPSVSLAIVKDGKLDQFLVYLR